MAKLTEAHASLVRVMRVFSPRFVPDRPTDPNVVRHGLWPDIARARRAGLLQSAGLECSVTADEWLESPEGRRALTQPQGAGREG